MCKDICKPLPKGYSAKPGTGQTRCYVPGKGQKKVQAEFLVSRSLILSLFRTTVGGRRYMIFHPGPKKEPSWWFSQIQTDGSGLDWKAMTPSCRLLNSSAQGGLLVGLLQNTFWRVSKGIARTNSSVHFHTTFTLWHEVWAITPSTSCWYATLSHDPIWFIIPIAHN